MIFRKDNYLRIWLLIHAENDEKVIDYLLNGRCIDKEIVNCCKEYYLFYVIDKSIQESTALITLETSLNNHSNNTDLYLNLPNDKSCKNTILKTVNN